MLKLNPINLVQFSPSFCARKPKPKPQEPAGDTFERTITGVPKNKVIDDPSQYYGKHRIAKSVFDDAQRPWEKFNFILEDVFAGNLAGAKNSNNTIKKIQTQIKSVPSIHEKMASNGITSQKAALAKMDDIIRGRIIYNHGKKRDGNAVADALIDAINREKINIVEIVHHRPNNLKERDLLEYITSEKMREVEDTLEKKGKAIRSVHKESRCGYLADHIIISIPGTKYKAEIQIMGEKVAEFKEIEDFCYKMKCGKKVANVPKELTQAFKTLLDDEDLMHQFNNYTRAAYKLQRLRDASSKMVANVEGEFLKLNKPSLPKILDFNTIAKLIRKSL